MPPVDNVTVKGRQPAIERGQQLQDVIFKARRRPMSREALHAELTPIVAAWIRATCLWEAETVIGDHRFVVFAIDVAPDTQVYIQFWSEPLEPVDWEVSSGRSNPRADEWLAGERSRRIEAFGFEIGGNAGNYYRDVTIRTESDVATVARRVVDVMFSAFDYRGLQPITAHLLYDTRAEPDFTYSSFTPEDLSKIFRACGFRVAAVDDGEDAPVLRAVRRGIETRVVCVDRVRDERLYQRVMLTSDVEAAPAAAEGALDAMAQATGGLPDSMQLGTTLIFEGGVTIGWVVRRLHEWNEMTRSCRQNARRRRGRRAARVGETIH
jgi:hypothetical protein